MTSNTKLALGLGAGLVALGGLAWWMTRPKGVTLVTPVEKVSPIAYQVGSTREVAREVMKQNLR